MLVTYEEGDWGSKVGFVDDNGACLEYEVGLNSGWIVADTEVLFYSDAPCGSKDIDEYVFDPTYIRDVSTATPHEVFGAYSFRLVADDKPDLYLVVYNHDSLLKQRAMKFKAPEDEPLYGAI